MFLEGRMVQLQSATVPALVLPQTLLSCFDVSAVSDVDSDHKVGRHEFADFIFHMAAADLAHGSQSQQEVLVCPSVKDISLMQC